jgi:MinD-like ATPase involved in chromosome partitioning or flagellar assembly
MIQESHVVKSLDRPVLCTIQNDSRIAPAAINVGDPFVLSHAQSAIAKDILNLAALLTGAQTSNGKTDKKKKFLFFGS